MKKEYKIEITEEKKYTISIQQINSDIDTLNRNFERFSGAWEYNDGDYGCISIAEDELMLCKGISDRYPFKYQYNLSDFDKNPNNLDEDWSDIKFDINDFNENNVNKTNYDKVDAVADDFRIDLIAMLESLKKEIQWLPSRFRQEFIENICENPQTAKSIRKNSEYFAESILDELTEEEKASMFVAL